MRQAIVAVEDGRFYEHRGVDLRGLLRAFVGNATGGTVAAGGGGSTLTQQYVKNVFVERREHAGGGRGRARARTLTRKLKEMRYALALEKTLTKDQILERYLNIAYFGAGAYGVEAASRRYFSKHAEQAHPRRGGDPRRRRAAAGRLRPHAQPEVVAEAPHPGAQPHGRARLHHAGRRRRPPARSRRRSSSSRAASPTAARPPTRRSSATTSTGSCATDPAFGATPDRARGPAAPRRPHHHAPRSTRRCRRPRRSAVDKQHPAQGQEPQGRRHHHGATRPPARSSRWRRTARGASRALGNTTYNFNVGHRPRRQRSARRQGRRSRPSPSPRRSRRASRPYDMIESPQTQDLQGLQELHDRA